MTIPAWILVYLLVFMSLMQALSREQFVAAIATYGIRRPAPARLAGLLWSGQLVGAALLLIPSARVEGALVALVTAIAWTVVAAIALARRRDVPNCGCYGRFLHQRLRWHVLLQDAAFIALAVWALVTVAG